MVTNTISENKTITGNGIGTLLAGRYQILRQVGGAEWRYVRK